MTGVDSNNEALVSVVMNCFNGEEFLREAIDSVYAQTWSNWEIIFWDNASTDRTGEIARSYDQRLRYFRANHNTPLGEARNKAMSEARGEFIAMLDSDDVWFPGTIRRLADAMSDEHHDYAVCYGGVEKIDAAGRSLGEDLPKDRGGDLLGDFLLRFDILPSAAMIRRSTLLETGHAFDVSLTTSEDVCFFMTLAAEHPFRSLTEAIARYRVHQNALTNRSISKWADEWQYTLNAIIAEHPEVESLHSRGIRHMRARIDYYRARNLMHQGKSPDARRLLRRNATVDPRFFLLFLLSVLPRGAWNMVHGWYHKRSQFS